MYKKLKLHLLEYSDKKYNFSNNKYALIIIILLFSSFILLGIDSINNFPDPETMDTGSYLGEANLIKSQGGIPNFINLLVTGKYIQANRNPLYILFITPFASTEISFFTAAKMVSLVFGLLTLVFLFILGRKMFGDLAASIAVLALVLNPVFIKWNGIVGCETLLMLFSFLSMYYIIAGFDNNKNWIYAGIFAGLAFLTKSSALLLIPGFGLAALIVYRFKIIRNKYFWSFFILAVVIASPLIIRNIVLYKNPLFNVNVYIGTYGKERLNDILYKVDNPREGTAQWKFDDIETLNEGNTKSSTVQSSGFAGKLIKESKIFLNTINLSIFRRFLPGPIGYLFALLIFLFFIIGIFKEKNAGIKIYLVSTLLIFFIVLSINPIDRYFLPLVPIMWIYIAYGIIITVDFISKKYMTGISKPDIIHYIPHFLILFLVLNVGYLLLTKTFSNPLKSYKYSESRYELLNWLRENLKEDDKYSFGPPLNWQLEKGIEVFPPKNTIKDFSKFNSFIHRHNIQYVIIDWDPIPSLDKKLDYQKLFEGSFEADKNNGIIEKRRIDNWELVFQDNKKPVEFLVYKVN